MLMRLEVCREFYYVVKRTTTGKTRLKKQKQNRYITMSGDVSHAGLAYKANS